MGWTLATSLMIVLNQSLDASPRVRHRPAILRINRDSKDARITVRGWKEGRDEEVLPIPSWLDPQLTPEVKALILDVRAGAFGYEYLVALGVPDP